MRIHLAQRAEAFAASMTPWLAEITSHVLLENKGVPWRDTVIQITRRGYFWRSDLYHLTAQMLEGRGERQLRRHDGSCGL
jgi:hypothetical protein